jgi:hypothetical protein
MIARFLRLLIVTLALVATIVTAGAWVGALANPSIIEVARWFTAATAILGVMAADCIIDRRNET